MKKILTILAVSLMALGSVNASETAVKKEKVELKSITYSDFAKNNPEIKKFLKIPRLSFEKKYSSDELSKLGYFLDDFKSDKISFYGYVNENPDVLGVKVAGKSLIINKKTGKIDGLVAEFVGVKTKDEFVEKLSKDFGNILIENQENEVVQYFWGVNSKDEKLEKGGEVISIILSFDIYNDAGTIAWMNPQILFK